MPLPEQTPEQPPGQTSGQPPANPPRARHWLWLSLMVILLDQATKLAADAMLELHRPLSIAPMFNLTLVYNPGAAFSFLSDAGGWQRWFFIVISTGISAMLLRWVWTLPARETLPAAALSLILGGALGNLLDRLAYGYVIDFIDVYYHQYHWPVFNIADSAITIGACLFAYDLLFRQHGQSDEREARDD